MMTTGLIDGSLGTEARGGRVVSDFDTARAQLMVRAAAPNVLANVLKLAYVIAYKHMNVDTKMAIVGQEALAADLNVTVRTIQSLLARLEPLGLVVESGDGRSKLSVYRIGSLASDLESAKAVPIDAERTNDIASFDGETTKADSLFPELTRPAARKQVVVDGFAAFWQAYPRRIARGQAEKAYRRIICNREATEAELLGGAMRYAAQRDGEDPQFTKHPATWLNGKCWMDEPPPNSGRPRNYLDSIAAGLALVPDEEAAS